MTEEFPYEFHITVDASNNFDLDAFKTLCKILSVKPIVIDLEVNNIDVMQDVMTSSHLIHSEEIPYDHAQFLTDELGNFGFDVKRVKIETVPWHPSIPSTGPKDNCYFESHIGINLSSKEEKERLDFIIKQFTHKTPVNQNPQKIHLSKNFFKKEAEMYKIMATIRSYNLPYKTFLDNVNHIKSQLSLCEFLVDVPIIEYAIFDSNIHHDEKWIGQ